jgi:hypothetical protein
MAHRKNKAFPVLFSIHEAAGGFVFAQYLLCNLEVRLCAMYESRSQDLTDLQLRNSSINPIKHQPHHLAEIARHGTLLVSNASGALSVIVL